MDLDELVMEFDTAEVKSEVLDGMEGLGVKSEMPDGLAVGSDGLAIKSEELVVEPDLSMVKTEDIEDSDGSIEESNDLANSGYNDTIGGVGGTSGDGPGDKVIDESCGSVVKKFVCGQCGKRFGTKGFLNRHERSHTGETEFVCEVCKKIFTRKNSLQHHMKVHTDGKKFEYTMASTLLSTVDIVEWQAQSMSSGHC
ncbi:hypothetical protein Pcinc_009206 [Petrolisthes cinctipes]|uniref:C2H2-type domain-containing protein n=1 Tax=Petrolisthes cinctipes TaxID=88211 RepID=A0AAE1G7V2_PETCI|nr:hypothetical protein Pcinc_009206 [Petrolisthes cinctipes]